MTKIARFDWSALDTFARVVIVCHASYELARSQKLVLSAPSTVPIERCIISASISTLKLDANYRSSLEGLSSAIARSRTARAPDVLLSERADLLGFIRQLHDFLEGVPDEHQTCVLLDISVFPRDRLFVAIDLIRRLLPHSAIRIGYSEPNVYSTDRPEGGWLSKGVVEVISLPGFNGRQDPAKQSLLVLNVGHEIERMSITINNREPQKLILIGQGDEQLSGSTGGFAARLLAKIQSDYGPIVDLRDNIRANSKDVLAVRDGILDVYDRFGEQFNISVAFLGTKVQAIGALLACQKNRNIEAVYAQPQLYHREAYSDGVSDSYMLALEPAA